MSGRILGVTAGLKGDKVSIGTYAFKYDESDKDTDLNISALQLKGTIQDTNRGVGLEYEVRVARLEVSNDSVTVGTGLQVDTGLSVGEDGFKLEVLGFGFSAGNDGVGFKLPFFDMKFK